MKLYSSILGLPVLCSSSEEKLGTVKDILFCSKKRSVFGFVIEERGFFSSIRYIPINEISKFNKTSLIVESHDCIMTLKPKNDFCSVLEKESIKFGVNSFIYTEDDELIGQVKDIIFDFNNNIIEGYVISKGYFDDFVLRRLIVDDNIQIDKHSNKFITVSSQTFT